MFRIIFLLSCLSLVSACGAATIPLTSPDDQRQGLEEAGYADNEIDEIIQEEESESVDPEVMRAILDAVTDKLKNEEGLTDADLTDEAERALEDEPEPSGDELDELLGGTTALVKMSVITSPLLEEVIPSHNNANGEGRENLVFIGYGNRTKQYFIEQTEKIIDSDGIGVPDGSRTAHGLLGLPVFVGHEGKFNFWYVDLASAGISAHLSNASLCSNTEDFDDIEDRLGDEFSFPHLTFIHMLSNTNCRSQASWFRMINVNRLADLVADAADWRRIWRNVQRAIAGRMTLTQAFIDGVNWRRLADNIFDPEANPRIFLNLYDNGRSQPRPRLVHVATHEFGHALVRFMDEYANPADVVGILNLLSRLDVTVDLNGLLPSWLRATVRLPTIRVNVLSQILDRLGIFASNCASTKAAGDARWAPFMNQGEGNLKIQTKKGCFYFANKFYRSSIDSKMRTSESAFNIYQEDYIERVFLDNRWQ